MPGVSELARQAAEAEQPLFGAPERSRRYDAFAVSQRAIGESLVHPSHRVVDEDLIGIASDPVCQVCRRSLLDSPHALREPCVPVRCTCWPANGCGKCVPALAAPIDDDGFITPDIYLGPKHDLSTLSLPDADELRGQYPMADGLLDYFPNALAEVSKVSKIGNDQHNPGEPMHWARDKSTDHANKIMRHLVDRGKFDGRGVRHTARLAWRALAMLQDELEAEEGFPRSRASA